MNTIDRVPLIGARYTPVAATGDVCVVTGLGLDTATGRETVRFESADKAHRGSCSVSRFISDFRPVGFQEQSK